MRSIVILSLILAISAFAQTREVAREDADKDGLQQGSGQVWQIPFASSGNTISLSIQNNSSVEAENVSVTFNHLPAWLSFKSTTALLKDVSANSSGDAEFTFSIEKKAPVGKDTTLTAMISTSDGQIMDEGNKGLGWSTKGLQALRQFPESF